MIFDFSINKIVNIYENIKVYFIEKDHNKNEEIIEYSESKEMSKGTKEEFQEDIWQVEIPKINLVAPISEGTSQEVMLEFVGHFEDTSKWQGNVGLAAHNRGYPINYFSKVKDLIEGDEIIYKTKYGIRTYRVEVVTIIEDTDWSYLQETQENKITLITCVEDKPNLRLCVQGIEIKEE